MGRSVSYATDSVAICYQTFECEDDISCEIEWEWFIESIQTQAQTTWPSLTVCDEWVGREDHAILENEHCYIGVSEYCGLVSIWLLPKDDIHGFYPNIRGLSYAWCGMSNTTRN